MFNGKRDESQIVGTFNSPLDNLLVGQGVYRDLQPWVQTAETVDNERKVMRPESFACIDPQVASFVMLEIPNVVFGRSFQFEDFFSDFIKSLTGVSKFQFPPQAFEKFNLIVLLKSLDPPGNCRLGDVEILCGCAEVPMFSRQVENFQLVEVQN